MTSGTTYSILYRFASVCILLIVLINNHPNHKKPQISHLHMNQTDLIILIKKNHITNNLFSYFFQPGRVATLVQDKEVSNGLYL